MDKKDKKNNEDILSDAIKAVDEINEKIKDNNEKDIDIDEVIELAKKTTKKFKEQNKEHHSKKKSKTEEFKNKYLSVLAEMENFRKRLDQEKRDLIKYRSSSFIQNILPTIDMFELAVSSENVSDEIKNWLEGFKMILRNFKSTLEAEGIKEIIVKPNDEFNSKFHHAIEEVETSEFESGKIIQVKQKGYLIHDRLLRPATVVVAKQKNKENLKGENNE
ncbi:MAG: protein GrpE [Candidatus Tyloplasma litorale]|nr:MAG: protein GrpE [Mycoplasmatales bacterium]